MFELSKQEIIAVATVLLVFAALAAFIISIEVGYCQKFHNLRCAKLSRCWSVLSQRPLLGEERKTSACADVFLSLTQCMVRPCVARRFRRIGGGGLASMYPASDWSVCAPGHHGYQHACVLISGQASIGPFGSPVFARARKTDPPFCLVLSQTSAGNC
jgi:hypothetical protein